MKRLILDTGALVSCVSFLSGLYLWMGYFQTTV